MDKNSILGLLLMGLIIFGFTYINRPSPEELERQRIEREQMEAKEAEKSADPGALKFDSITSAEVATIKSTVRELGVTDTISGVSTLKLDKVDLRLSADGELTGTVDADGRVVPVADIISNGSALPVTVGVPATANLRKALATVARYRGFARHITGASTTVKLENKVLSLELSNKGGVISRATLRDYDSYDSTKVALLSPETDLYSFTLTSANQRFETREFYFNPVQLSDSCVLMQLDLGDGAKWGIRYTLPADGYLVKVDIVQEGMQSIIPTSVASMDFTWHQKMRPNEAGRVFEERNSALYYMDKLQEPVLLDRHDGADQLLGRKSLEHRTQGQPRLHQGDELRHDARILSLGRQSRIIRDVSRPQLLPSHELARKGNLPRREHAPHQAHPSRLASLPLDQHSHYHSGVHNPRKFHLQLRYHHPAPHNLHQDYPLPLHLQEPHVAGTHAPARA